MVQVARQDESLYRRHLLKGGANLVPVTELVVITGVTRVVSRAGSSDAGVGDIQE